MSTSVSNGVHRTALACLIGVLGCGQLLAAGVAAEETTARLQGVTRSVAGFSSERADAAPRDPAMLEETQLPTAAQKTSREALQQRSLSPSNPGAFRIYDADTELFYDFDSDGYYHYLRVTFDADTDFVDARVFAQLYLRRPDGPWQLYFVTDTFAIEGSSPFDDYEVETELVTGYPPDSYDVLIELYDADFGDLVEEYGPYESSALSLLPLEDTTFDDPLPPPITISHGGGGGGSMSWALLVVGLCGLLRPRIRRHQT